MILISHRGNITGSEPANENKPEYINKALDLGFEVEIDVWYKNGWFLGHDKPEYKINQEFLSNKLLWCHAKNLSALAEMLKCDAHCFWHEEDDYTLTSKGIVWTYPSKPVCKQSVIVCKTKEEAIRMSSREILGVCSDYVGVIN